MEAISLFYRKVKLEKNLPFDAKIPNDETLQAIEDAEKRKNLTECDDVNDLLMKFHAWARDPFLHRAARRITKLQKLKSSWSAPAHTLIYSDKFCNFVE